jgi:hypothetical protein
MAASFPHLELGNRTQFFWKVLRATLRAISRTIWDYLGQLGVQARVAESAGLKTTINELQAFSLSQVVSRILGCGAGDGNRTHGSSLGSLGITIIRRPRREPDCSRPARGRQISAEKERRPAAPS